MAERTWTADDVADALEQQLTAVFEHDGAAAELHIGFHLVAFFQEVLSMLGFKVKVMIIRIGCKPDLFQFSRFTFRLHLFLFLLLLVEKLIIVNCFTHGRNGLRRNLYQVEP